MGGWNLFWGLLNFAILAAALWFIGRKLVVKMFTGRRDAIAEELRRSEQADKNALELEAKLGQNDTLVQEQCEEILRRAQEQAEEIRLEGQQLQRKSLEQAANQSLSEERMLRHRLRQELNRKAADDITTAAAELIMGEEFAASRSRMSAEFGTKLEKVFRLSFAEKAVCAQTGLVEARLACAEEPSEALAQQVRETILARMQSVNDQARLELSLEAEPELIAGGRLYLGDTVFDGSVQGMLRMVEKRIANNTDLDNGILESVEEILRSPDIEIDIFQTGHVVSLSDGICHVAGVSDAMYGELLDFAGDLRGVVMDLERDYVGVAMLGNYDKLQEGDKVYRTGRIVEVPVGEKLLGRIVDALGRPIDGGESFETEHSMPIEGAAPGVIQRKSVGVPMQTGIKAIDALVPIGRGQRELIIGDRQTGKTSIALDTIINQKGKDMICIYVAIGQKESSVAGFVEKLKEHGAMDYTIVVCASASESAPMLYIAPYAGTAMGEYFMNKGRDVLIVYDDLSKHAVAYREISLLLHRPPGREAYPGDIFYLHSRLLERAARLSEEYGGGSMTALPIVETQAGDISSYIPTNVISITDGQVFLETELFNAGMRPAINVGLSVSRVGGSAQLPAMKQVSGRMRMDLAQYRELAAFSQFGSELDKATLAALTRGERMTELLKQPQYSPMEASDQVVAIMAVGEGYADDVPLEDIARFERELLEYVRVNYPQLSSAVMAGEKLSRQQQEQLRENIVRFKKVFR